MTDEDLIALSSILASLGVEPVRIGGGVFAASELLVVITAEMQRRGLDPAQS